MTQEKSSAEFQCGLVSIVGRPNVGKSTLLNALVEKELSITSAHPHTTRRQIRAVDNAEKYQIIYVDTPGIHKPSSAMGQHMNDSAFDALSGVDLVLAIFDASAEIGKGDAFIAQALANHKNVYLVLNKVDAAKSIESVAEKAQKILEMVPHARHVFMLSAFTKKNVHLLREAIVGQLPVGPALFDRESEHDMTDAQIVAELYREQLLWRLRDELPQGMAVIARQDTENTGAVRTFDVRIVVNKESHKPMIIGKGGSFLQAAGSAARSRIEALLGEQVGIRAKVEVDTQWQSRIENLDSYFL